MFSAEIDDSGEPFLMRAIVKKWGNSAVRSARIHAD
jgi:hypothetical protein